MTTTLTEADLPDRPAFHSVAPFDGPPEQAAANQATHTFWFTGGPDDADIRCDGCDCRYGSKIMDYPCGDPVDRVARYADGTEIRYTEGSR